MKQKNASNESVSDIIWRQYEKLDEHEQLGFLYKLMDEKQNPEIDLFEMLELTKEYMDDDLEAIVAFTDKFREKHPEIYSDSYQFPEKKILELAFYYDRDDIIQRSLSIIKQNPVHGIDVVTIKTLYNLIYSGRFKDAVDYSSAIWKTISDSDKLWGSPEIPFLVTIYLSKLEEQYSLLKNNDSTKWKSFVKEMKELGFDTESERIETTFNSLTEEFIKSFPNSEVDVFDEMHIISLNIYFLRYMKDMYNMSFQISDRLFNVILYKGLYKRNKKADSIFYFDYNTLDKHIAEHYDYMYGTNQIEIAGKVLGLHYVYEYLNSVNLISGDSYSKMLVTIAALKKSFLKIMVNDLWELKFVTTWPVSDSDILKAPDELFENREFPDHFDALKFLEKRIPGFSDLNKIKKQNSADYMPNANRNDLCPCGSGKKYKKCCLNKNEEE